MGTNHKKQKGETYDAYLVKDIAPIEQLMTSILGERIENEALCNFDVETAALDEYLAKKNAQNPEYKYTFFHVFCAAVMRTVAERPRLNYFIRNGHYYERKEISIAAIAKKQKKDGAEEGMIIMRYRKDSDMSPVEQMHTSICKQVYHIRKSEDSHDSTTDVIRTLTKLPYWLYKAIVNFLLSRAKKGKLPKGLIDVVPYYRTIFISNLGSIKMKADYHHLTNFGTTSLFGIIGKKECRPVFAEDGSYTMKNFLPLSLTIDERIGDGVYFANSIKILKAYLLKPELLDLPANQPIDIKPIEEELGL